MESLFHLLMKFIKRFYRIFRNLKNWQKFVEFIEFTEFEEIRGIYKIQNLNKNWVRFLLSPDKHNLTDFLYRFSNSSNFITVI